MPTNVRDPRSIITPDAFGISPELLGTPLARPRARFWAMMIDLVVVGVLTAMLGGVGLFVWGAVALLLLIAASRMTGARTTRAVSVLLRVSAGCLGLTLLGGVVLAWLLTGLTREAGTPPGAADMDLRLEALEDVVADVRGPEGLDLARLALESVRASRSLAGAETAEEAEDAAARLLSGLGAVSLDREERRELLMDITPPDAPWAEEADAVYERALDRWEASRTAPEPPDTTTAEAAGRADEEAGPAGEDPGPAAPDSAAVAADVAALDDARVLEAYGAALRAGTGDAGGEAALRVRLLHRRAMDVLAGDSLTALTAELTELHEELAREEALLREARRRAEDGGSGLVALLRDIWEQLGSAIGLWSIYFTVLLTLFGGRTMGKRVLGIRVVRLDGEPMTWWTSFERAGGYVAGLATGLLGFAQVLWDPNRQCIHDKIVGTVVVDDRAERVPGSWEEVWQEPPERAGSSPNDEVSP